MGDQFVNGQLTLPGDTFALVLYRILVLSSKYSICDRVKQLFCDLRETELFWIETIVALRASDDN